jgi:hypothetical protein
MADRKNVAAAALAACNGDATSYALVQFDSDGGIWANRGLGDGWINLTALLQSSDAPDEAMEQALTQLYPECSTGTRETLISLAHMAGTFIGAGSDPGGASSEQPESD